MPRLLLALALALAVSACAASTIPGPAEPARGHMASTEAPNGARRVTHPETDVTCQDETPTGTLLERRKCRSDAEREQDLQFTRNQILDPGARPGCDPTQGPCVKDSGVTPFGHH